MAKAAEDYKTLKIKEYYAGELNWHDTKELNDIIKFFDSDWYTMLTKVDNRYLIEELDKEIANEIKGDKATKIIREFKGA